MHAIVSCFQKHQPYLTDHDLRAFLATMPEYKRIPIVFRFSQGYEPPHAGNPRLVAELMAQLGEPAYSQVTWLEVHKPADKTDHQFRSFVERLVRWMGNRLSVTCSARYTD